MKCRTQKDCCLPTVLNCETWDTYVAFCKLLAGNDYTITVRPKLLERIANGQTMMTVELKFQKLNGAPIGAEVNAIVDRIRIGLRYNPMA